MAQIEETTRRSKRYSSGQLIKVDLTPMVDLGFLLITFFILTTTLSEPTMTNLILPKDSAAKILVKRNAVLTLMLTRNDSIKYFDGSDPDKVVNKYCTFKNLRSVIQQKQKKVASILGNSSETTVIIYPEDQATYKNFIDAMDEIQINDISHYFVMNSK